MVRAFVLYEGELDAARYYAEFEFPDLASFREISGSPEFGAAGNDASGMGVPVTVHFAEIA